MDFNRHTIVFFHAGTLSSSSFKAQMQDPRLNANFNLLFMDARFHGGTEGGKRDTHKLEVSSIGWRGGCERRAGFGGSAMTDLALTAFSELCRVLDCCSRDYWSPCLHHFRRGSPGRGLCSTLRSHAPSESSRNDPRFAGVDGRVGFASPT